MTTKIRLRFGTSRRDVGIAVALLSIFLVLAIAIGFIPDENGRAMGPWASFIGSAFVFAAMSQQLISVLRHRRFEGMQLESSENGLLMTREGEPSWEVVWDEFGGYQLGPATFLEPNREVVIIHQNGSVVGQIPPRPVQGVGSGDCQKYWASILAELDAQVPSEGILPIESPSKLEEMPKLRALSYLIGGGLGLVICMYALRPSLDSMIIGIALCGGMSLGLERAIRQGRERAKLLNQLPKEGPSSGQLLAKRFAEGGKVKLRTGFRYQYAHPDRLRMLVQSERNGLKWLVLILGVIWILLITTAVEPFPGNKASFLVAVATILLGMVALSIWGRRRFQNLSQFLPAINDSIEVGVNSMRVTKEDGSTTLFPLSDQKPTRVSRRSEAQMRSLRRGDAVYVYDPTQLYEVGTTDFQSDLLATELSLPLVEESQSLKGS